MAFTLTELEEMMRLLQENPSKREALRYILLGEELLRLPEQLAQLTTVVAELVESFRRLEYQTAEHTRILQSVLQVQQEHSQKLDQHSQKLDQHSQILEQHTQELREIREVQQEHSRKLDQHTQILEQHSQELREIREVQQEHSRKLDQHTQILEQHTQKHDQHTQILDQHTQELREIRQEIQEFRQQHSREIAEIRQYIEQVANAYGLTLEGEAEEALAYLAQQKGWRFVQEPHNFRFNGYEIDLIAVCEDEQGQRFTVLVEVKARLVSRVVREWANRSRSANFRKRLQALGYPSPYYMYIMAFRFDPRAEETARKNKVGLFTGRGERVEPEPLSA